MKKKMVALIAGALIALSTSSAFAFVSANLELYRVIYDSTTNTTFEAVTDMGSLASLQSMAAGSAIATSSFNDIAGFSAANTGNNLMVAYFAYNYTGKELYISQTGGTEAPVINPSSWGTAGGTLRTYVAPAYATAAGAADTGTLVGGSTNSSSFSTRIGDGYIGGAFAEPFAFWTAVPLATLASTDVTDIYQFTGTNLDEGQVGTLVLSLTTDTTTGLTSIAPAAAATPIPPAFFLMGSGLLGMVGLRRKQRG